MKLQKIVAAILLMSAQNFIAHDHQATEQAVQVVKAACHCGPTEHWLYKVCVKNYMTQFADAGLNVNDDSEGLSDNLVQAIEMIAADLKFVDDQGNLLVPALSAKGNLLLPMNKNADYKLVKAILHEVDMTTTLSAQELYEEWTVALHSKKAA